jgi:hypothetical protein
VDVFLPAHPLAAAAIERRVRVPFGDADAWIVSAEDLALLKLVYGRTKDFADLERLFAERGKDLDYGYLERWVASLFAPGDPRAERFRELASRARGG